LDDERFVWEKIASTRPSGLEKIVGRHRNLDGQTDSFSALYIYIDFTYLTVILEVLTTLLEYLDVFNGA